MEKQHRDRRVTVVDSEKRCQRIADPGLLRATGAHRRKGWKKGCEQAKLLAGCADVLIEKVVDTYRDGRLVNYKKARKLES